MSYGFIVDGVWMNYLNRQRVMSHLVYQVHSAHALLVPHCCTITTSLDYNHSALLIRINCILFMCFFLTIAVQIECYNCVDRMSNTTCGEPKTNKDLGSLDTITCKHGACIKWTYYKSSESDILIFVATTAFYDIHFRLLLSMFSFSFG